MRSNWFCLQLLEYFTLLTMTCGLAGPFFAKQASVPLQISTRILWELGKLIFSMESIGLISNKIILT
jgi:hypothetical protein